MVKELKKKMETFLQVNLSMMKKKDMGLCNLKIKNMRGCGLEIRWYLYYKKL